MKKKAMVLAAAAVMAMSSICSASIGSQMDKDDKATHVLISALAQKDTEYTYDDVAASFNEDMKAHNTAADFTKMKRDVATKLGQLEKLEFVQYTQATDQNKKEVAILTYAGTFSKEKNVMISIVYDKSGKMVEFRFTPLVQQARAAAEAAK